MLIVNGGAILDFLGGKVTRAPDLCAEPGPSGSIGSTWNRAGWLGDICWVSQSSFHDVATTRVGIPRQSEGDVSVPKGAHRARASGVLNLVLR